MTRIRLIYLDREIIRPISNVRMTVNKLRQTDHRFIGWEYV